MSTIQPSAPQRDRFATNATADRLTSRTLVGVTTKTLAYNTGQHTTSNLDTNFLVVETTSPVVGDVVANTGGGVVGFQSQTNLIPIVTFSGPHIFNLNAEQSGSLVHILDSDTHNNGASVYLPPNPQTGVYFYFYVDKTIRGDIYNSVRSENESIVIDSLAGPGNVNYTTHLCSPSPAVASLDHNTDLPMVFSLYYDGAVWRTLYGGNVKLL